VEPTTLFVKPYTALVVLAILQTPWLYGANARSRAACVAISGYARSGNDGQNSTQARRIGLMLAAQRRVEILQALDAAGTLTTDELAQRLCVSGETIRRDLLLLDRERLVRRVHGGAMATPQMRREEPPYSVRAADSAAKHRIGQLAASLVNPGQTIVFDVGTTVLAAARALPANFSGVAVTCSLVAASELATRPGIQVLIAGGRVRPGDLAVFEEIHADVAFLGSGCVSPDDGLTDFYIDEIATRRVLIANSATTYVLADSSKLGKVAPHRVCGVDEVTAFITDQAPPEQMETAFRAAAGHILYPVGDRRSG
jgi:DeoR/GlpR family transcriptional regulator of sugar metabolism